MITLTNEQLEQYLLKDLINDLEEMNCIEKIIETKGDIIDYKCDDNFNLRYRVNSKDNSCEYNHFESTKDNHLFYSVNQTIQRPTPMIIVPNSVQKGWTSMKWKYTLGKLNTKTHQIVEESNLI